MRLFCLVSLSTLVLSFYSCSSEYENLIVPDNNKIVYEGRFIVSPDSASFSYPGSSIRMRFTGSSIAAKLKRNAGYFLVEIDSQPPFKLSTFATNSYCSSGYFLLADGLDAGVHSIQITLLNEGLSHKPQFYGFRLSEHAVVVKPTEKKRYIEFIGDSQTCGYGVEAPAYDSPFTDSTENFSLSFAGIVSKRFDAKTMVVARSGIGVYRNFGDVVSGSKWTLPMFYEQTFIYDSPAWDFSGPHPDVICVCLGTNDLSSGDYDLELFQGAYLKFAKRLIEIHPKSKLIILGGAMLLDEHFADQKKALDFVAFQLRAKGGVDVFRFDFTPQDGSLGYGADWHPSKAQQLKMADELTSFIESVDSSWKRER